VSEQGDDRASGEEGEIDLLRTRVDADPGCAEFPALAELERRAGRVDEARQIAERGLALAPNELAGRVVLGLVCLDLGDLARARDELAGVFADLPETQAAPPAEAAPASARSTPRAPSVELPVGEGSAFRTRTMARLLERQGDRGRAEAILEELGSPETGGADDGAEARVRETLERWLRNLQGGRP